MNLDGSRGKWLFFKKIRGSNTFITVLRGISSEDVIAVQ